MKNTGFYMHINTVFQISQKLKKNLNRVHNFLSCAKYIYKNISSKENQVYMLDDIFFTWSPSKIFCLAEELVSFE